MYLIRLEIAVNDERRGEKFIQKSRQRWVESGLHPPEDDPQE
ncbi:hypothetical protein [Aphanizomenon sp. UHCC 0183]|nr:hypothetical protein [Aphanizomenon sp. UHCC 0183]